MGSFDTVMIAGCHRGWIIVTPPHQSFLNSLEQSTLPHGRVNGTSVFLYIPRLDIEYLFFYIRMNYKLVNKKLWLKDKIKINNW